MEKTQNFADRLHQAINQAGSPVCVGIDPVVEAMPTEVRARHHDPLGALSEFCSGVLGALVNESGRTVVPAVKFQSACFERYGSRGIAVLEEQVARAVALGLIVLWDAKRGDISTSAGHYAAAAKRLGTHAITVNAYLGCSGVEPFVAAGLGVFVLVRTSNPDSDMVQAERLADGRTVAEMMAAQVEELGRAHVGARGLSTVGAVVGATKSADGRALRKLMPNQVFLVPGYGAQGGAADDIRALVRAGANTPGDAGVLVTASRSITYAPPNPGQPWTVAVRDAAQRLAEEVGQVVVG